MILVGFIFLVNYDDDDDDDVYDDDNLTFNLRFLFIHLVAFFIA